MNSTLASIIEKIEEVVNPASSADAVVIFENGPEKTLAAEELVNIVRCVRKGKKPLGILFYLGEANRLEEMPDLIATERTQFEARVERFMRALRNNDYDDNYDEFDSEEEEEASAVV